MAHGGLHTCSPSLPSSSATASALCRRASAGASRRGWPTPAKMPQPSSVARAQLRHRACRAGRGWQRSNASEGTVARRRRGGGVRLARRVPETVVCGARAQCTCTTLEERDGTLDGHSTQAGVVPVLRRSDACVNATTWRDTSWSMLTATAPKIANYSSSRTGGPTGGARFRAGARSRRTDIDKRMKAIAGFTAGQPRGRST